MAESVNSEEIDEIQRNWQKMENNMKVLGLGDGKALGTDSTFQENFDKGFLEGFRNGYAIGQFKGTLFAEATQKSMSASTDPLLEHANRAWCQICQDKELLSTNIPNIVTVQNKVCKCNLDQLHSTYKSTNKEN